MEWQRPHGTPAPVRERNAPVLPPKEAGPGPVASGTATATTEPSPVEPPGSKGGAGAHLFRCGCNSGSLQVEGDAAQDALVGGNVHRRLLCAGQVHELHVAGVRTREGQEGVVAIWAQDTEA